jgi:hypothetical protein
LIGCGSGGDRPIVTKTRAQNAHCHDGATANRQPETHLVPPSARRYVRSAVFAVP